MIKFDDRELVVREFTDYMQLVDRFFGRTLAGFASKSLVSYSLKKKEHLRIESAKAGSLEFFFEALSGHYVYASALVATYLCLRHLPAALRAVSEVYRNVEEGRLARVKRQEIEGKLATLPSYDLDHLDQITIVGELDDQISEGKLSEDHRSQLIDLVRSLYDQELESLADASEFAQKSVIEVRLEKM